MLSLLLTPSASSALNFRPASSMMASMLTLILTGLLFALRTRRALALENLALRHQLAVLQRAAPRPRLRRSDRLFWVLLSRLWRGWAEAVSIVQPETVIRWHRTGFRLFWTWKSRRHGPGRPAVAPEVRALIRRMAEANALWGAPRIHGELQKLGLEISQATVSKYMARRRTPPSQTWRTFLDQPRREPRLRGLLHRAHREFKVLFVFVVLAHDRRRVVHINVTDAPTAQWTAQQLVEAFPWETAPRYLLRDRDAVYGVVFSSRVQSLGIREVKTAPRSPWQNPYVERLIGTLRRECLDHVVVLNDDPPASPAARLPHLLPRRPDPPLPGEGRPGAQTGGAPRPGRNRRDTHGRRPASSVHTPGGVRSFRPAGCAATLNVAGRSVHAVPRSSSALRLELHGTGPRGVSFGAKAHALNQRPQPILRIPGWVKRKAHHDRWRGGSQRLLCGRRDPRHRSATAHRRPGRAAPRVPGARSGQIGFATFGISAAGPSPLTR